MVRGRFTTITLLATSLTICCCVNAVITPITLEIANSDDNSGNSSSNGIKTGYTRLQPNEFLPIPPLLIYPKARELHYQGRNWNKENSIIRVKLLQRSQSQSYRPSTTSLNEVGGGGGDGYGYGDSGEDIAGYATYANLNELRRASAPDADVANNIIAKPEPYTYTNYKQAGAQAQQQKLRFKDVYYVKALANGQFSHERIKVYQLPEFYAINVFRNEQSKA